MLPCPGKFGDLAQNIALCRRWRRQTRSVDFIAFKAFLKQ
jgi:hypothetical protein